MRISDWSSDVCSSDLYGIKPFRYTRMHRQTVIIRAPASFVQMTLWPEFEELSSALTAHLDEITTKIIREEVHEATQDADEIREPRQLRRGLQIGRAHVCTPVTNAHLVCRLLLDKKKK